MIMVALIGLVYNIFMFLFGGFEPLSFNVDSSVYEYIHDFVAFIFYVLPVSGLKPMYSIIVSIIGFRIIVSLVKTIWQLLPIL